MDQRPECKSGNHKTLIKKMRKNLLDINISPQARETKAKMNKWDYIKLKSYCTEKDTISRLKRHPTVWEGILISDISDKG